MHRPLDDGVSSPLAFLLAGSVLLASVATILATTGTGGGTADDGAGLDLRAEAVLERWLSAGGVSWSESGQRLTFSIDGGGLDWDAVQAMQGAGIPAKAANGLFDYEEAREGLGLAELDADVHLRIQPLILAGQMPDLSGMRVAYIGDWEGLAEIVVPLGPEADMVAGVRAGADATLGAATLAERALLDGTGADFADRLHLTAGYPTALVRVGPVEIPVQEHLNDITLMEGDVYPDLAEYLPGLLAARLPDYDVLVIGSGVEHEAIDDAGLSGALRSFVEAGGAIIAFGSHDTRLDWSDDVLDEGEPTANRIATSPDHSHPILHRPNDLDWDRYTTSDRWDLTAVGGNVKKDRADLFQVVLGNASDARVAISRDGALGDGHILFTSYRPSDLIGQVGEAEAAAFVENLLSHFGRKDVTLDFGATAPGDVPVSSAQRTTHYMDPVEGQHVLRVTLLYWER